MAAVAPSVSGPVMIGALQPRALTQCHARTQVGPVTDKDYEQLVLKLHEIQARARRAVGG